MDDKTDHISQLITKHLRGELTVEEKVELKNALETHESVRTVFDEVTDADKVREELAFRYRFNKEAGYARVQEKISAAKRR